MYQILFQKNAEKSLFKIAPSERPKIITAIRELAENPRPSGSKKLTGREAWRIRVGDYRVIYEIFDGKLIIDVVQLGHRKDIYR